MGINPTPTVDHGSKGCIYHCLRLLTSSMRHPESRISFWKIVIGRLKLPMELWCGSDGAAFASKLAVCPITPTPPLTGLKPAYDENCQGIKLRIAHKIKRLNSRYHDDIIKAF